jgi:hypothetical protein
MTVRRMLGSPVFYLLLGAALLAFLQSPNAAAQVRWPENGHYYSFERLQTSWTEAKAIAESRRGFSNWHGHLATITSAEENAFVLSIVAATEHPAFAWIGGYEPGDDGRWVWGSGPELGTQFSQSRVATAPSFYANWGGIEPNDHKADEDYLMMNVGGDFAEINRGQWADADRVPNPTDPVIGFVVEYESEGPPRLAIRLMNLSEVEISYLGFAGSAYELQASTSLDAGSWTKVADAAPQVDGPVNFVQPINALNRYYRVLLRR